MIWILLTIIITSSFFILFRYFSVFQVNSFQAIVFNYATCVVTGLIYTGTEAIDTQQLKEPWVFPALLTGVLFLVTFNLMALTVAKVSVTASSVANKTSLVIPVAVNLLFLNTKAKPFSAINYLGIALAIAGIILSSFRKKESGPEQVSPLIFILPLLVFLLGGAIDTIINILNLRYLTDESQKIFPIVTFVAASFTGLLMIIYRYIRNKEKISLKAVLAGVVLGIPNYFSILVLLKALSAYNNDGAFVFPIINTGIIILSSFLAVVLFREKITLAKGIGIILAILAIVFIYI